MNEFCKEISDSYRYYEGSTPPRRRALRDEQLPDAKRRRQRNLDNARGHTHARARQLETSERAGNRLATVALAADEPVDAETLFNEVAQQRIDAEYAEATIDSRERRRVRSNGRRRSCSTSPPGNAQRLTLRRAKIYNALGDARGRQSSAGGGRRLFAYRSPILPRGRNVSPRSRRRGTVAKAREKIAPGKRSKGWANALTSTPVTPRFIEIYPVRRRTRPLRPATHRRNIEVQHVPFRTFFPV